MSNMYISAKVEGDEFFYEESHEWKFLPQVAIQWITDALTDMNQLTAKLASKGVGTLKTTLTMQIDDQEPVVVEHNQVSYKDVAKVQKEFLKKSLELVEIAEKRNK